jgi:O-antigen/teichoic acid export membrane protein
VCVASAVSTLGKSIRDVVRGYERADISAYAHVGGQILIVALVVPTLVMGGGLQAALWANLVASAVLLVPLWRVIHPVGIPRLTVRAETLRKLYQDGKPFLLGGLIVMLQPVIDALVLAELAPAETVGWHGAARKLVNVLVFPANALVGALYPTLCRLWVHDRKSYFETARSAMRGATTLTVPVAVACFSFPQVGIQLFGEQAFAQAENNLRVLSVFVLLVYLSMTLGTALAASGKQRPWTAAQVFCVVFSAVADPFLVPWFQRRYGNGGLGISLGSDICEVLMFSAGAWLAPRGILDRGVLRTMACAFLAGGAMAGVAHLLSSLSSWIAAPAAIATYLAALLITGGTDRQQLRSLLGMMKRG